MNPKWILRIGIGLIFALLTYYGYMAKKSYEESLGAKSSSYYRDEEVEGFVYDLHGHAYRDIDDSETYFFDDPKLQKHTVVPAQSDMTLPKPLTIEDLREARKDQPIDEFETKGKITRDRDSSDSRYMYEKDAYDGSLPGRY